MILSSLPIQSITVLQLKELLIQGPPPLVLDVREEEELKICALPTFVHIPLSDLLGNLSHEWEKLPIDRVIVMLCHHGRRSLQAALFLKSKGYDQVLNLAGGIHAWATQIDGTMARY